MSEICSHLIFHVLYESLADIKQSQGKRSIFHLHLRYLYDTLDMELV